MQFDDDEGGDGGKTDEGWDECVALCALRGWIGGSRDVFGVASIAFTLCVFSIYQATLVVMYVRYLYVGKSGQDQMTDARIDIGKYLLL